MSGDGPSKAAPEAEPLDDIILGDDDATEILPSPPVAPKPSQPPPLRASSQRPPDRPSAPPAAPSAPPPPPRTLGEDDPPRGKSSSNRMKRAKMTLRIPDDEISRPNLPATTPMGGVPALTASQLANAHTSSTHEGVTTRSRPPSSPDDHVAMPLVRPLTGPPPAQKFFADDTLEFPNDAASDLQARIAAATAQLRADDDDEPTMVAVSPATHIQEVAPVIPPPTITAPLPGPLPAPLPPPKRQPSRPAFGVDPSNEPGWTPFQPETAPIAPTPIIDPHKLSAASIGAAPAPITQPMESRESRIETREPPTPRHADARNGGGTILDPQEVSGSFPQAVPVSDSVPPVSEDIPVDMDIPESDGSISIPAISSDEVATSPRLPLDSEDIRIDEGDRISETGEVEVAPEDLVSVESLPAPGHVPPPLKTAGKYPAFKEVPPAEIQGLAQAVENANANEQQQQPTSEPTQASAPHASPSHPQIAAAEAPTPKQAAEQTPSTPPPPVVASPAAQVPAVQPIVTPQPVAAAAAAAAATATPITAAIAAAAAPSSSPQMAARRQSNPLIFVPPVGALAPPPMTDTAAHRKKTRPWWEELFNDDFIRTMAKVTDAQIGKEVNFIEESLGCEAGAMILDLACGTGRHAVELAARGYQVVGFDLSLAMLARASDEAQDRKQKINFVQGDMREMTFEETFDGVYSWNTSFGFFDEEKNGAVIARVHKSLKKGGQFLLDVINRDFIIKQAPSLAWFEGDGCICMDEMTIDFITSRMKVKRTLMMDDGRTKEIEYSVRIYSLHELGKMLHDNGFRVAEVSGRTGTPGVFFGNESPRTLILAEKR